MLELARNSEASEHQVAETAVELAAAARGLERKDTSAIGSSIAGIGSSADRNQVTGRRFAATARFGSALAAIFLPDRHRGADTH